MNEPAIGRRYSEASEGTMVEGDENNADGRSKSAQRRRKTSDSSSDSDDEPCSPGCFLQSSNRALHPWRYPFYSPSASYRQVDVLSGSHQYTVSGFSLARSMGCGTRLCSDFFEVAGQMFRLEIYPAGFTADTRKYISVFLTTPGTTNPNHVLYEIAILDQSGKDRHIIESRSAFEDGLPHGGMYHPHGPLLCYSRGIIAAVPKFIKASFVCKHQARYLPHDMLVFRATVHVLRGWSSAPSVHHHATAPSMALPASQAASLGMSSANMPGFTTYHSYQPSLMPTYPMQGMSGQAAQVIPQPPSPGPQFASPQPSQQPHLSHPSQPYFPQPSPPTHSNQYSPHTPATQQQQQVCYCGAVPGPHYHQTSMPGPAMSPAPQQHRQHPPSPQVNTAGPHPPHLYLLYSPSSPAPAQAAPPSSPSMPGAAGVLLASHAPGVPALRQASGAGGVQPPLVYGHQHEAGPQLQVQVPASPQYLTVAYSPPSAPTGYAPPGLASPSPAASPSVQYNYQASPSASSAAQQQQLYVCLPTGLHQQ